ncbi:MAG: ATP-dependent RNA helicase HrpA [Phycisphaeraceae bacterium]|nr:ATP-dependent RNA helicase HrpA [Phycisphaeraceae bacterium]
MRLRLIERPEGGRGKRGDQRRGGPPGQARDSIAALGRDIDLAIARRQERARRLPRPSFDMDLPVLAKREEIAEAISKHQVVIVCGETGSGKTTQLPKICLSLGRGIDGYIGHTQPRRIAARSVAARLAEELNSAVGSDVGYKVRFGDKTSPQTYIKVMTDGILLAETQGDRMLDRYDTLIIDEAHERSLNVDFLLGYLRRLLPRRPDLKVIITSATIDPERFAIHFKDGQGTPAPIIEVSGRTFPVEIRYRPLVSEAHADLDGEPVQEDRDLETGVLHAVHELAKEGPGDILVFLSGEREIRDLAESLRKHHPPQTEILPLYARLSADEQMRVFKRHVGRRIVLSTNVAETSLTVPGIRYVVDAGEARISRYNARSKVQRLPIEAISQASANQRSGRCGRVAEGVAIRLYSEQDFLGRDRFTDPEIQRANLASVILQMKALGLGSVEAFPFIDPPDSRQIRDGYETLRELGATDDRGELTQIGVRLSKMPIDPRVGRMILAAEHEGCLEEALVIAAALSVQDPRERPMELAEKADAAHLEFRNEESDFLGILGLWRFAREQERHLSHSKFRKMCKEKFISFVRLREWEDIHKQLRSLVLEMGVRDSSAPDKPDLIHRALLTGLLTSVGKKEEDREYAGCRGLKFVIHPGSGISKRRPGWIMAAELVQTTRLFARTCARINPEWIEELGGHLLKRSHSDPMWDGRKGRVLANEKATLYGLEVVSGRRVDFGKIDAPEARAIFIQQGLVEGEVRSGVPFIRRNRALIEDAKGLEARARTRDLLVDAGTLYGFYNERLPAAVHDVPSLERWWARGAREDQNRLYMSHEDVLRRDAGSVDDEMYPERLPGEGLELPLSYVYQPGDTEDGVTVTVPLEALGALDEARLEWLVPGMVREKVLTIVKALPKQLRRLYDAPALAERVLASPGRGKRRLADVVREEMSRLADFPAPTLDEIARALPDYLRMNVRVLDANGETIGEGRDPVALKRGLQDRVRKSLASMAAGSFNRDRVERWDIGDLPDSVRVERGGVAAEAFPALVDEGKHVALRVLPSADAAAEAMRIALPRLYMLEHPGAFSNLKRLLPGLQTLTLAYATIGNAEELKRDLLWLVAYRAFMPEGEIARTERDFRERAAAGYSGVDSVASEVVETIGAVLRAHQSLRLRIAGMSAPLLRDVVAEVDRWETTLIYKGFLVMTPWERLVHLPRYIRSGEHRLMKLGNAGLQRDARMAEQIAPYERRLVERVLAHRERGIVDMKLDRFRWMLEEFRVSLFAQELGTAETVSPKRLEQAWAEVRA